MKQTRRKFSREFKMKAVKMLANRGERTIESIAKDLEIHANLLIKWREEFSAHAEETYMGNNELLNEVERLRREVKELKIERDILKKAVTIFSRHQEN